MQLRSLFAAVSLALSCAASAAQAQTVVRFSSFEPPNAFVTAGVLVPWAERVNAASNGTLNVQMFAGATLGGGPAGQLSLLDSGVADIAFILPGFTPGVFPGMEITELPFTLPDSQEVASAAMWRLFQDGLLEGRFDKYKVVMVGAGGQSMLVTNGIKSIAELKGQKLSVTGAIKGAALEALGAITVGGIAPGSLTSSIDRGLIRGLSAPWSVIESFKLQEVTGTYVEVPLGHNGVLVLMNKAKYDSLPEAARKAIDDNSGEVLSRDFGVKSVEKGKAARENAVRAKQTIITPTGADRQAWADLAEKPALNVFLAKSPNNQKALDALRKHLKDVAP